MKRNRYHLATWGLLLALLLSHTRAAQAGSHGDDFNNEFALLSLDELMAIQVTSIAGVAEDLFRTPAGLYVVTDEDVRRTGHQLLPEVFRNVPGMTVAKVDSRNWQIGIRGYEGLFHNKSQVLMDGREIYEAAFGGVLWDAHEFVLEDLDRIEVVRGPGATLWGTNAVHGVINITTKSAKDTQGFYASGLVGSNLRGIASVRYGDQVDENSWFRVWGKYIDHGESETSAGADFADDWDMFRGGFRFDHEGDDGGSVVIDGAVHTSGRLGASNNTTVPGPPPTGGGFAPRVDDGRTDAAHLLGRVAQEKATSGWSLQASADWLERVDFAEFQYERVSIQVDWKHHFQWADGKHEAVWGLNYRGDYDNFDDGNDLFFNKASHMHHRFSGFLQDTWQLAEDEWYVMLGSKIEYNTHTKFELQPSVRLWWTPDERNTIWAAVSRPVRTPNRTDEDLIQRVAQIVVGPVTTPVTVTGSSDVVAETIWTFEAGYRTQLSEQVSVDIAGFWSDYNDLAVIPTTPGPYDNSGSAETYGGEVIVKWLPADNLMIEASYSHLHMDMQGSTLRVNESTPEHQGRLRLAYDLTEDIELNAVTQIVSNRPTPDVGSYTRFDVGVTWRPTHDIEISAWGQNLFEENHLESTDPLVSSPVEVPRSMYVQATWRF